MTELADTSAWSWSRRRGASSCCTAWAAPASSPRCATSFRALRDYPIDAPQWKRALWVYEQLSAQGGTAQRSVKDPDLLIAAAAEAAGFAVLHYDEDYERIAAITGQPTRWLAPAGSLR